MIYLFVALHAMMAAVAALAAFFADWPYLSACLITYTVLCTAAGFTWAKEYEDMQ